VIVHDLDVFRSGCGPPKADAVLVVDTDAVLPLAIAPKRLKPVSRRHAEVLESASDLQLPKLASGDRLHALEPPDPKAAGESLGIRIRE
jgi:hypothetical protein